MQDTNYASLQLDYYRQRQSRPGWQDLLQILFSGILSTADDEDGRQFLNMMGSNLAKQHPLPLARTVGELEDALNGLLTEFDWGFVKIEPAEQELTLVHCAWPTASPHNDDTHWRYALATVLEGAYSEWLQAQGGKNHVPLRWQNHDREGSLVFRYKNGL